jgi:hypothetical protein
MIGATSLADSYTNEAGGAALAPGVAPTWTAGVGQVYAGAQWLLTGLIPAAGWSMLVRFSGATTVARICGSQGASSTRFRLAAQASAGNREYANGGSVLVAGVPASGVLGVAGQQGYLNGVPDGGAIGAWSGTGVNIGVGCYYTTVPVSGYTGTIAALAIYSGTLSAADVTTITAAMNALPTAAGMLLLTGIRDRKRGGKTGGKQ